MIFRGEVFALYCVEDANHTIILHATDPLHALYCAREGWTIGENAKISLVEDATPYADLEIGMMRDLRNPH